MAVEPLLERHSAQQIVDVEGLLLLDHAIEGHGPWTDLRLWAACQICLWEPNS